ncbi:unnamed protein product [Prorocentrum cordatum]|uniref:Uncharacterized protein n=1 Tax=Prorocentrum cordatum TaxID=2364126 RepID=A0ABN9TTP1_9DINO|nr:unnamed protein product [Polarella glacialis]CAK0849594.1 unnamed protein product [Polarella glacialis]
MTTRSLPLVLCAACCYVAAASGQECWGMGETCGDDARCSGMDTRCGDRSECSGSSSTCGANSICSGIGSQCGPGSQCTGLGSLCAGGGQQAQSESEGPMHFKPMQPMHFKKMHFEPMKTEKPQKVFVHGCDQGDVCSGRPDAAQSNGVTVCCQEGCAECSASTSQSGNELTATCVCSALEATTTEQPKPQVKAMGCEMGSVCRGRPGAAQTAGMELCCPESCANCMVYGELQGGDLTEMCMCALTSELTEEPREPKARADEGCAWGLSDAVTLAALTLGAGCVWALVAAGRKLRPCAAREPLLSA